MNFRRGVWLFAVLWGASAGEARADEASDKAASNALFEEGRKLMSTGSFDEACRKFASAQKLSAGIGISLNLADCLEKNGKPASAWREFQKAKGLAHDKGDGPREALARTRADALEPRVPHLRIIVGPDVATIAGLVVTRNGETLPESLWGSEEPVDPGTYLVEASAGGKTLFSHSLDVSASDARMTMTIAAVAYAPPTPTPVAPPQDAPPPTPVAPTPQPPTPTPEPLPPVPVGPPIQTAPPPPFLQPHNAEPLIIHHPSPAQKIAGYVFGGAAIVAAGIGSGFAALALINTNKTKDATMCGTNNHCNADGFALRETAIGQGWAATGLFIGAASSFTVGIVLVATAPTDDDKLRGLPGTTSRLRLDVTPTGAALRGVF